MIILDCLWIMKKKLKEGNENVLNLMRREEKKFEKSLMFAGGTSFNGLGSLILCEVPMNTFSYGQILLIYKEDCEKLKNNKKLFFE